MCQEFFGGSQLTVAVLGELSSLLHLRGASTPTVDSVVIFVIIIFIFFIFSLWCFVIVFVTEYYYLKEFIHVIFIVIFSVASNGILGNFWGPVHIGRLLVMVFGQNKVVGMIIKV